MPPAEPSRLVLWDIDGTLVDSGGVGALVFEQAIELVLGVPPGPRPKMGGKTDPQIVREYLAVLAPEAGDDHLPAVLEHLSRLLGEAEQQVAESGRVLPGVPDVLARVADDPRFVQTVLTGNLVSNAGVKLAAFGLDKWLDLTLGAFGSDDADRLRLVPIALDRVAERRGRRFSSDEVWVVGDTANDLACARAVGARCLLVATGSLDRSTLEALGADAVLDDLVDTEGVVAVLAS
jgi:phosphoglycolate phosphatase